MEKTTVQIIELLNKVMEDVGAVRKGDRNSQQNFNFRGIDAVMNAVSPALRKHGVIVTPNIESCDFGTVEIGKNHTSMGHCRVTVTYKFWAPDGTFLPATVVGEAMDSGDKAHAKAMSVAFRTALLQTLCLPTDETDPDAESYERAPRRAASKPALRNSSVESSETVAQDDELSPEQRQQLQAACGKAGIDPAAMAANAGLDWTGNLKNSDIPALRAAFKELKAFKEGN